MALSNELKLAIQAKLRMGMRPKDVAEEFNVRLPTVYSIGKKIKEEEEDKAVAEVCEVPRAVLQHVIEESKKVTSDPFILKTLDSIEVGADGLKKLDAKFQETVAFALTRFDMLLQDEETPLKDIKLILDTTSNAYEKVFNSGTNIHIGDNNTQSTQQLTIFKNKMGV